VTLYVILARHGPKTTRPILEICGYRGQPYKFFYDGYEPETCEYV